MANNEQEGTAQETLENEDIALSSSELDNIISSAEIEEQDDSEAEALEQYGEISIDFVTRPDGSGGYMVKAGQPGDCSPDSCDGCG